MSGLLGIGVITYNRLPSLQRCLQAIEKYTRTPYEIVLADDGSQDGTVDWACGEGYAVIAGPNRGCAWNKNRALYYFMEQLQEKCDPILLIEDDTYPNIAGWEDEWIEAARIWRHVNYSIDGNWQHGLGTAQSPYQCGNFSAECTVTTRAALERVGYLDSRFIGYGAEHVEWTTRFRWEYEDEWKLAEGAVPCLHRGVTVDWQQPSSYDEEQIRRNNRVFRELRAEPIRR